MSFSASRYTSSLRGVIAAHYALVGALVALIVGLVVDFGRKMRRYQRGVAGGRAKARGEVADNGRAQAQEGRRQGVLLDEAAPRRTRTSIPREGHWTTPRY